MELFSWEQAARQLVRALDETVWTVNPRNDSLANLLAYVTHYAEDSFFETPVRCQLKIPVDVGDRPMAPELHPSLIALTASKDNRKTVISIQPMKTKIIAPFRTSKGLTTGFYAKSDGGLRRLATATLSVMACALMSWPAAAATINWGTATSIAGDTDVSANGTALYAYTGGTAGTVNGVSFSAGTGFAAWGNVSFTSGFTASSANGYTNDTPNGLSQTYSNLLVGAASGGTTAGTVTLNGLTVNEAYQVQIWVSDPRSAGAGRNEIVTNTVASPSAAILTYQTAGLGSPGQYVIGTFLANSTSQSFSLVPYPSSGGAAQLNAISVRDLGGINKIWLGATDTSWGVSGNWSPNGVPLAGQSVVFNNLSTANLATMPDQSYTLTSIVLSNAPSAVSIGSSGNTLTINGGINLVGSGQSLTINDPIVLAGFQTWTNNGNLTLNADISGSAGLTITGNGVMTISQPVTYLYKTTVSGGTLALSGSGSLASSSISIAGGATLDVSAESSTFTLGGRTLGNSSSGAIINGPNDCTSGNLNLVFDGTNPCFIQTNGVMTLSSSTVITVNYSGAVLPAGTNTLIAAATTGNVGQVTVLDSLPSVVLSGSGAVGQASLVIDGSGNLNLVIATPDVWTGATNNLWSNGGNWIPGNEPLSGDSILFNNLSTANLNVSQDDTGSGGVVNGLTVLNPAGPVTISGPGNLSVYGGGLNLSAASQDLTIAAPLIVNANQNWLVTNSRLLTISGPVSSVSGGNVTISGGGTVKLGAAHILDALTNNLSTCDLTVNGSKLDLNGNSQAMNGLNGSTNSVVDNTAASPVTLIIGGNGNSSTNSGVIQNSGGGALQLQVAGGDVQLLATNTYSGGTIFNGGRLYFPSASSLGTGPVTFNPGSGAYTGGRTFTNALTLNGGYLRVGGANNNVQTWGGPVTVINGFQLSGDSAAWGVTLSGPMNIGTGGITITNSGDNGPQMGFNVSTTGDLLSGTISGSGGITYYLIGGNSRLTVRGTNTYSGGTIVNGDAANPGGKLNVAGGGKPFSTGPVTLNANAIIESAPGSATITNALTLNGGTLQSEPQYNNYNTLTWSGPVTLTADSSLVQSATGALNNNQSSGVNVAGALNMNGFTLTCSSPVACYGGNTISGSISGTGTILQNGVNPQALTVSGSNTFSGTFRSVSGTLSVKNLYALQNATLDMNAADAGAVSISTNAIIGALTGSRDLNLGSYTISIGNNNASTTFSGGLSNSGSLIKVGSGTLTLSGVTSFAGNTTVNGGTLSLSQSPFGTNSTVKVAGGAILDLNYSGTNTIAGLVLNGVSKPTGIYNAANSGGLITGAGALQVTPPNAWIGNVSTSWNQTGNWAINVIPANGSNAVFNFYSTANLATVLNANFNLNTLLLANPSGPVSIADGGAYVLTLTNGIDMSSATQPLTITAPVVIGAPQTWTVAANMTLSVNGPVTGTDLTVSGSSGTVSLGGTNNYGATTISSGATLQISGTGQLGSGNYASNIVNSGTLKYSSSADQTLSGTMSGNGAIIKDTSSTSTLTIGAPTASGRNNGNTTVSAGTLAVNSAGSLYSTSTYQANSVVTVNSGATLSLYAWQYGQLGGIGALDLAASRLRVNGGTIVYTGIGEGAGSGNSGRVFTIGAPGATLDAEGAGTWNLEAASATYDGSNPVIGQAIPSTMTLTLTGAKNGKYGKVISGAGSLIKSGAGIWTLANTNSYAGGTAINGGTLLVNNTVGSGTGTGAVNINNGGTLSGTGIISGLVTNNAGGILQPGVGNIGKLTLNGNVTLLASSTSTFLVDGSTAVASNSVAVGAAITYGGVLNIATNGIFTAGQKFTLFSGTGATNTSNFASIAGSPGAGLAFSFTNGVLSVVTSVLPNPVINSVTLSGGNLILQGNNGAPLGTYAFLTSTNVALPLSSWTTNSTGTFTASGSFSNAIPVTSEPQRFFVIQQP